MTDTHWENESLVVASLPRVGAWLLAVFALTASAAMMVSVQDVVFSVLVALMLVPWLAIVLCLGSRGVPARAIGIDSPGTSLVVELRRRTIRIATGDVSRITLYRSLVWVRPRTSGIAAVCAPVYVIALYDASLQELVARAQAVGIRVVTAYGAPVGTDFDGTYAG